MDRQLVVVVVLKQCNDEMSIHDAAHMQRIMGGAVDMTPTALHLCTRKQKLFVGSGPCTTIPWRHKYVTVNLDEAKDCTIRWHDI